MMTDAILAKVNLPESEEAHGSAEGPTAGREP